MQIGNFNDFNLPILLYLYSPNVLSLKTYQAKYFFFSSFSVTMFVKDFLKE